MCLSRITKIYPKRDKTEGFGWKVICDGIQKDTFVFPYYSINTHHYNKWLRRIKRIIITNDFEYESGFHIFKNKKDALFYKEPDEKVVRVQYKGIICSGIQADYSNYYNCLVVKQIKVLK